MLKQIKITSNINGIIKIIKKIKIIKYYNGKTLNLTFIPDKVYSISDKSVLDILRYFQSINKLVILSERMYYEVISNFNKIDNYFTWNTDKYFLITEDNYVPTFIWGVELEIPQSNIVDKFSITKKIFGDKYLYESNIFKGYYFFITYEPTAIKVEPYKIIMIPKPIDSYPFIKKQYLEFMYMKDYYGNYLEKTTPENAYFRDFLIKNKIKITFESGNFIVNEGDFARP